ncbi:hypothetical protein APSETT444_007063 [Aspergillus pseudonomiae]
MFFEHLGRLSLVVGKTLKNTFHYFGHQGAASLEQENLVLYNVALRYVEFRKSHQPGQTPAYGEMDEYLAALGLSVPLSVGIHKQAIECLDTDTGHDFIGHEYKQREEPTMSIGNEANLDGWFSSNRAIMGLLQE